MSWRGLRRMLGRISVQPSLDTMRFYQILHKSDYYCRNESEIGCQIYHSCCNRHTIQIYTSPQLARTALVWRK